MKENEQETPLSPSKAPDPQGQEHVYISSLFQMSGAHCWRLPKSDLLFWLYYHHYVKHLYLECILSQNRIALINKEP